MARRLLGLTVLISLVTLSVLANNQDQVLRFITQQQTLDFSVSPHTSRIEELDRRGRAISTIEFLTRDGETIVHTSGLDPSQERSQVSQARRLMSSYGKDPLTSPHVRINSLSLAKQQRAPMVTLDIRFTERETNYKGQLRWDPVNQYVTELVYSPEKLPTGLKTLTTTIHYGYTDGRWHAQALELDAVASFLLIFKHYRASLKLELRDE